MKKLLFTILSVILTVSVGYTQVSKNKTLVEVRVESKTGKGLKDKKVLFESMYTGKKFKGKTGPDGLLVISLFSGDRYKVNVEGLPRTERLVIPRDLTETLQRTIGYYYIDPMTAYSLNKTKKQETTTGTFNLSFKDLNSVPLEGEEFLLVFKSTNDTCIITTNNHGKGSCPLVAGELVLSSYENPDFESIKIPDNHLHQTINYKYKTISTTELKIIDDIREGARLLHEKNWKEDSIRAVKWRIERMRLDSIRSVMRTLEGVRLDSIRALTWKADSIRLAEANAQKAQELSHILEKYPDEKHNDLIRVGIEFVNPKQSVINEVFDRNTNWKRKLIIVDVTGSMHPYTQQLGVWYVLNQELSQKDYFVWFQDGDHKATSDKIIGSTGGIYDCNTCDLDAFIRTRDDAMSRGGGGDGPENDIEALLHGLSTQSDSVDEVILIADNYSSCRDLSLISKLNRPIRIIACGSDELPIHPDYIQLAYKTGGSIHTLKEDITGLTAILDGQTIKIGDQHYKLMHGRFLHVSSE